LDDEETLDHVAAFAGALKQRWLTSRPDVVHAHYWTSGLAAVAAARELGVPLVGTFHQLGTGAARPAGQGPARVAGSGAIAGVHGRLRLERAIGRDCTRVVATSSDEAYQLVRLGVDRRRIRLVPCGIDVTRFAPEIPAAPKGERHRILAVGALTRDGGADTVITALSRVPDTELLIVGGPDGDRLTGDPDAERLGKLAAAMGVADRVRLLGHVAYDALPGLIRSADLVVSVPWHEPYGFAALEAMACGVPVVASPVGSLVDAVVDGSTGAHVPPGRPDLLAPLLRRLLADPVRREAYGIAGADRARVRYRWERIASDLDAVYGEVVAASAAA